MSAIGSRVGDVPVDEDCAQEGVIRYWEQLVNGRPIRSAPAWVKSVARNLARDESRRRYAESRALQRLGLERNVPLGLEEHPFADELRVRISRLARRQREIVVLFYFGDLSVAEVAAEAGCRVGTVKATLHQARRALADALRPEGITGWAGFWMRVDSSESPPQKSPLAFYNNEDRALTGTTSWVAQDAVLDVANEASVILIGAILSGKGSLHVADLHVDVVGRDVEITRQPLHGGDLLPEPTNLSFQERS